MWYRIEIRVRSEAEDDVLRNVQLLANTYAIVDVLEASRSPGEDPLITARIDAPNVQAALGSVLTVLSQTSGHAGLAEAGSVRGVVVERE
ncbi:MAG TPA: hypothetical protein VFP13_05275 [Actinomycetota bacterium]|nr:hypothetical protein [Actinomycetota bacterium]